jgi:hypothetical protein
VIVCRNQGGAGHLAGEHLDFFKETAAGVELDPVDSGGLEAGHLKGERVGSYGKFGKLIASIDLRECAKVRVGCLGGDYEGCVMEGVAV